MNDTTTRRQFFAQAGAAAAGAALLAQAGPADAGEFTGKIKKAVKYGMIKEGDNIADKFTLIKELGFDGVEPNVSQVSDIDAFRMASEATGIPIHGVVNGSVENISHAIDVAKGVGASSVLLVAGRVDANTYYADNYRDTQKKIRAAIPKAEDENILLLVENVWNNFLMSPLEMRDYVDELESDHVGVYFDVGNCVRWGYPHHWIPALGDRIKKLDIKEYSVDKQKNEGLWNGFNVKIGDGSVDWPRVRKELAKIGYTGWATAEVGGGNRDRLADIASRMDKVLAL